MNWIDFESGLTRSRFYPGICLEGLTQTMHVLELGYLVLRPRLELGTSRIKDYSATFTPTRYGLSECQLLETSNIQSLY
jgi:hypothetical protein